MLHEEDKERNTLLPYLVSSVWPEGAEAGSEKMIKVIQSMNKRYQELSEDLRYPYSSLGDAQETDGKTENMELQVKEEGLSDYKNDRDGSLHQQNKRVKWDDSIGGKHSENLEREHLDDLRQRAVLRLKNDSEECRNTQNRTAEHEVKPIQNAGDCIGSSYKKIVPNLNGGGVRRDFRGLIRPPELAEKDASDPDPPPACLKECIGIVTNLVNDNYGLAALTLPGPKELAANGPHLVLFDTCEFWVGDKVVADIDADATLSEVICVGDMVKVNAVNVEKVNNRNIKYLATAVMTNGDLTELMQKTFHESVKLIQDITMISKDKLNTFQIVVDFLARQTDTLEEKEAVKKSDQLAVKIFNLRNIPTAAVSSSKPVIHPILNQANSTIPPLPPHFLPNLPAPSDPSYIPSFLKTHLFAASTSVTPHHPAPSTTVNSHVSAPSNIVTPTHFPSVSTRVNPYVPVSSAEVTSPYFPSARNQVYPNLPFPITSVLPPYFPPTSTPVNPYLVPISTPVTLSLPATSTSVPPPCFPSASNQVNPYFPPTSIPVTLSLPVNSTSVTPTPTARVKATDLPGKMCYWNDNLISNIDPDGEYIDCVYCMETLALKEDDKFAPYYLKHYANQSHLSRVSSNPLDQDWVDKYLCGTCMLGLRMRKEEETGTAVVFHKFLNQKFKGRVSFYQCRYGKCDEDEVVSSWHFYHLKDSVKHNLKCTLCKSNCSSASNYQNHLLTHSSLHAKKMKLQMEKEMEEKDHPNEFQEENHDERASENKLPSLLDVKVPTPAHIKVDATSQNSCDLCNTFITSSEAVLKEHRATCCNQAASFDGTKVCTEFNGPSGCPREPNGQTCFVLRDGSLKKLHHRCSYKHSFFGSYCGKFHSKHSNHETIHAAAFIDGMEICGQFNGPKGCPREPNGQTCVLTDGSSKKLFHRCSYKPSTISPYCGKFHSKHSNHNIVLEKPAVSCSQVPKKDALSDEVEMMSDSGVCQQFNGPNGCPREPNGQTCVLTDGFAFLKKLFHRCSFKPSPLGSCCGKFHSRHLNHMNVLNNPKGSEVNCGQDQKKAALNDGMENVLNNLKVKANPAAVIDGTEVCGQFNGPRGCPREPNGQTCCVLTDGSSKKLLHRCSYKHPTFGSYCGKFHSKYLNHKTFLEKTSASCGQVPKKDGHNDGVEMMNESEICRQFNEAKGCPREPNGQTCFLRGGSSMIHCCSFKLSPLAPHCREFHSKHSHHQTVTKNLQVKANSKVSFDQVPKKDALNDRVETMNESEICRKFNKAKGCPREPNGQTCFLKGGSSKIHCCSFKLSSSGSYCGKFHSRHSYHNLLIGTESEVDCGQVPKKVDPVPKKDAPNNGVEMMNEPDICRQFNEAKGCPREPNGQTCVINGSSKTLHHHCSFKSSRLAPHCGKFHSKHSHHKTEEMEIMNESDICRQFNSANGCPRDPNGHINFCVFTDAETGSSKTLLHRCSFKSSPSAPHCGKFHSEHSNLYYHNTVTNNPNAKAKPTFSLIDGMEICHQFNGPKGCHREPNGQTCVSYQKKCGTKRILTHRCSYKCHSKGGYIYCGKFHSKYHHKTVLEGSAVSSDQVKDEDQVIKDQDHLKDGREGSEVSHGKKVKGAVIIAGMEVCEQFNGEGCLREPNGQKCVVPDGDDDFFKTLLHRCSFKPSPLEPYCGKFHSRHSNHNLKGTEVDCGQVPKKVAPNDEMEIMISDSFIVCRQFNGANGCPREPKGQACVITDAETGSSKTLLHRCSFKSSPSAPHCGKFHSEHSNLYYHKTVTNNPNAKAKPMFSLIDGMEICHQFKDQGKDQDEDQVTKDQDQFKDGWEGSEVGHGRKVKGAVIIAGMEVCEQFNDEGCPREPNGQKCVVPDGDDGFFKTLLHRCSFKPSPLEPYCGKFHSKNSYHETVISKTSTEGKANQPLVLIDGMEVCVLFNSPNGCPRESNGQTCVLNDSLDSSSMLLHQCSYKSSTSGLYCEKFHSKQNHKTAFEGSAVSSDPVNKKASLNDGPKEVEGAAICGQFNGPNGCSREPKGQTCVLNNADNGSSKTLLHSCSFKPSPLEPRCGKFHSRHSNHKAVPNINPNAPIIDGMVVCKHFNGPKGCPREPKGQTCVLIDADNGSSKKLLHRCSYKPSQLAPYCEKFHSKHLYHKKVPNVNPKIKANPMASIIDGMEVCGQFNSPQGCPREPKGETCVLTDTERNTDNGSSKTLLHRCSFKHPTSVSYCGKFHSKHSHHKTVPKKPRIRARIHWMDICGQFNSAKGCSREPEGKTCVLAASNGSTRTLLHCCNFKPSPSSPHCGKFHPKYENH